MFGYVKLSGGVSLTMVLADLSMLIGAVMVGLTETGLVENPKWGAFGLLLTGAIQRVIRARTYEPMKSAVDKAVGPEK